MVHTVTMSTTATMVTYDATAILYRLRRYIKENLVSREELSMWQAELAIAVFRCLRQCAKVSSGSTIGTRVVSQVDLSNAVRLLLMENIHQ
jgi:hypothetical protein